MGDSYVNPFGMLPQPTQFDQNVGQASLYPTFIGAQNQARSQPFIDMAGRSQGLDLMKKQMETGEFMGPSAVAQREAERQAQTATSRATTAVAPAKALADIQKFQDEARLSPVETNAKIAQAQRLKGQVQGSPYQEFFSGYGNLWPQLKEAGPIARADMINRYTRQWHASHPDAPIPQEFQNIDESNVNDHVLDSLAAHAVGLGDPKFLQELTLANVKGGYGVREAEIGAGASVRGREIGAEAEKEAARIHAEALTYSPEKRIPQLRKQLRENPGDEDVKQELRDSLVNQYHTKNIGLSRAMINQLSNRPFDPKQDIEDYLSEQGVGSSPRPSGSTPKLDEAAKQAFGAYEPDKYDYRVGPNGKLQRKAK